MIIWSLTLFGNIDVFDTYVGSHKLEFQKEFRFSIVLIEKETVQNTQEVGLHTWIQKEISQLYYDSTL